MSEDSDAVEITPAGKTGPERPTHCITLPGSALPVSALPAVPSAPPVASHRPLEAPARPPGGHLRAPAPRRPCPAPRHALPVGDWLARRLPAWPPHCSRARLPSRPKIEAHRQPTQISRVWPSLLAAPLGGRLPHPPLAVSSDRMSPRSAGSAGPSLEPRGSAAEGPVACRRPRRNLTSRRQPPSCREVRQKCGTLHAAAQGSPPWEPSGLGGPAAVTSESAVCASRLHCARIRNERVTPNI
jgi:hypothetical protein